MAPAGSSRATMADVARAAGVSVMTVSYCYSRPDRVAPGTRRAVARAAEALGYLGPDPAGRSLRSGRAGSIGVVLGEDLTYAFDDPQARRFFAGVATVCRDHGVGMTIIPRFGDERDGQRVQAAAVDGFVVWTTVDADPVLTAVTRLGKPVVVHGGPGIPAAHLVAIDDRAAARAVAATVFRGAVRPAVVSFPFDDARRAGVVTAPDPGTVAYPLTRHRLLGILDHCAEAGIDAGRLPVAVTDSNDRTAARVVIDALLDRLDPPDAILAMGDELAFATLAALRDRGRAIPDEVSVSGWDDGPEAAAEGLTTVHQSLFEQGQQCARLALGDDPGPAPTWHVEHRRTTR